jgi:ubiquinone/menaquinone biosynthesis C-methylase UbiE
MGDHEKGQVTGDAAEVYEKFYLPALFQQWAEQVTEMVKAQPGQKVLDVACGTGVVARTVADRVGSAGTIVGIDKNKGMLAVAKRKNPDIGWLHGLVEALPFDSNSFDLAFCNFALMYFEDKHAAIAEMFRVLRPKGHICVVVWDTLENTPAYAAVTNDLLARLFGDEIADGFRAPYVLGDPKVLRALFARNGIADVQITTHIGIAHFPSIRAWIEADVKGWVLSETIDDAQFGQMLEEAEKTLQAFVTPDGTVAFETPVHIVVAAKT